MTGLPVPPEPERPSALPRSEPPLLAGRTAVVTGGGAGIGGGIVRALAYHGAAVTLLDVDAAAARRTARLATADGGPEPAIVIGDAREPAALQELYDAAGAADFLVNNVGDHRPGGGPFLSSSEDDWRRQYDINLLHVFRACRLFLPAMAERGSGAVLNVTSVEGMRGIPSQPVYGAFKAAVVNFTASLAVEVGRRGIRVNAIAPDLTDTPQTPMWASTGERYADHVEKWLPVGRFGHPSDHGDAAVFLLSDQSRFITGTTLRVDGGTLAAPGWYRRDETRFTNMPRPLR